MRVFYQLSALTNHLVPGSIYGYVRDDFLDAIYICKQDNNDVASTDCALSYDYGLGVYVTHSPAYGFLVRNLAQELTATQLTEWVELTQEILNVSEVANGVLSAVDSADVKEFLRRVSEASRGEQ